MANMVDERQALDEGTMMERMRCLTTGCNPTLNTATASAHTEATGHRTAKWPVRSPEGVKAAKLRNTTGYYRKYNTGEKSPAARGIPGYEYADTIHPFSEEAFE
jgi:hypothetical protein